MLVRGMGQISNGIPYSVGGHSHSTRVKGKPPSPTTLTKLFGLPYRMTFPAYAITFFITSFPTNLCKKCKLMLGV